MATLKELKNDIKNKLTPNSKINDDINSKILDKDSTSFELEEARYLLNTIAQSDFKGQDVQIVYNIALKLQTIIKNLKD